jgi:ferredoxin
MRVRGFVLFAVSSTGVHVTPRIRVDGERCRGHAICALLLSAHVELDEWGYPLIDTAALPDRRALRAARRAERACPRQALHISAERGGRAGGDPR